MTSPTPQRLLKTRRLLSTKDEKKLLTLSNSSSQKISARARVILLWGRGEGASEIGRTLGVSRQTASKWIERFKERGIEGLWDEERPGRPDVYSQECVQTVIDVARSAPLKLGLSFQHWSIRKLERYLNEERGYSIKRSRICQLLNEEGVILTAHADTKRKKGNA